MRDIMARLKFIITIILLGLLAIFALQNTAEVELSFLNMTFQSRRIVVIVVSLLVGLIIGLVFGYTRRK